MIREEELGIWIQKWGFQVEKRKNSEELELYSEEDTGSDSVTC